jgi:hypothetical protein
LAKCNSRISFSSSCDGKLLPQNIIDDAMITLYGMGLYWGDWTGSVTRRFR